MEITVLSADVINRLITTLDRVDQVLDSKAKEQPLSEIWLDISETCMLLRISKRTLQSYRDKGILTFSQIGGKIYFRSVDIEKHLESHLVKAFAKKRR